jgi:hypothetical protein
VPHQNGHAIGFGIQFHPELFVVELCDGLVRKLLDFL